MVIVKLFLNITLKFMDLMLCHPLELPAFLGMQRRLVNQGRAALSAGSCMDDTYHRMGTDGGHWSETHAQA